MGGDEGGGDGRRRERGWEEMREEGMGGDEGGGDEGGGDGGDGRRIFCFYVYLA